MGELQRASSYLSSIMREQAEAAGSLSIPLGCKVPPVAVSIPAPARGSFIQTARETFSYVWPDAVKLLQQAWESRHCAQEVLGNLSRRTRRSKWVRTSIPQLMPKVPAWGPGDPRPQLKAFHRHNNQQQGKKGESAQAQKSSK